MANPLLVLITNVQNLATRIGTELKAHKNLINGNAADLTALTTTNKTNLVAALNEIKAAVTAIQPGAQINDAAAGSTTTYSSNKITDLVTTAINQILAGAPAALDTLNEIDAALGNDANFAGTMTAALANRVRFDAAQVLTSGQQQQAQDNLSVYSRTQIGDLTVNLVTVFEAALV